MFTPMFKTMIKQLLSVAAVLSFGLLMSTPFEARQQPTAGGPSASSGQVAGRGGAQAAPGGRAPSIDERVSGMQKLDGYFPLYWDERTGSLFIEIPRFDTEFLYTTGLAAGLGSN